MTLLLDCFFVNGRQSSTGHAPLYPQRSALGIMPEPLKHGTKR
jgi:hypothetical protein